MSITRARTGSLPSVPVVMTHAIYNPLFPEDRQETLTMHSVRRLSAPKLDATTEPAPGDAKRLAALAQILGVAAGDLAAMRTAFDALVGPREQALSMLSARQREKVRANGVDPLRFLQAIRTTGTK